MFLLAIRTPTTYVQRMQQLFREVILIQLSSKSS